MVDLGFKSLLIHLISDYWLQNDWMATNKKKHWWPAFVHAFIYTLPFILLTRSIPALLVIGITHYIIDHTDIVSKLNQIKNWNFDKYVIGYFKQRKDGALGKTFINIQDGYDIERPLFLRIWLIIIQDNILHLVINYLALRWL